jgi:hypothetical protein
VRARKSGGGAGCRGAGEDVDGDVGDVPEVGVGHGEGRAAQRAVEPWRGSGFLDALTDRIQCRWCGDRSPTRLPSSARKDSGPAHQTTRPLGPLHRRAATARRLGLAQRHGIGAGVGVAEPGEDPDAIGLGHRGGGLGHSVGRDRALPSPESVASGGAVPDMGRMHQRDPDAAPP